MTPEQIETPTPPLDLEPIKARVKAATPGPWENERVPIQSRGGSNTAFKIGPMQACIYDDWSAFDKYRVSTEENIANADFIAKSITDIPALIAEVERLREVEYDYEGLLRGRPIPEAAVIHLREAMAILLAGKAEGMAKAYNCIVHAYSCLGGFDTEAGA